MEKREYILSEESAEIQLNILCEYYDFELDDLSDKVIDGIDTVLRRLKKAIRRGLLEISIGDENAIDITQNLANPPGKITNLKYKSVTAKSKTILGREAENDNYSRIYALVGFLTGVGKTAIQNLTGIDLIIVECLGAFFLTV